MNHLEKNILEICLKLSLKKMEFEMHVNLKNKPMSLLNLKIMFLLLDL